MASETKRDQRGRRWRERWPYIVAGCGICLSFFGPVAADAVRVGAWPAERYVDLGVLHRGKRTEVLVPLRNLSFTGKSVAFVESDCGCTATSLRSRKLTPLGETKIRIVLETTYLPRTFQKEVRIDFQPMTAQPARIILFGTVK